MYYHGKKITLENYWEIFGELPTDIQDEIRLAIIDETEIMSYVIGCGEDDYKLKQIRLAIREGLPGKYIKTELSAQCIKYLRYFHSNNIDIGLIEKYIGVLGNQSLLYIMGAVKKGGDIRGIDFTKFRQELIPIISLGAIRGYPMYIFEDQPKLTESYIRLLMSGMTLDIDVQPFIREIWSEETLRLLFNYAHRVDLNEFLTYITPKFATECVEILLQSKEEGLDIHKLAYRDEDGYGIYNEYQLGVLHKALKDGYKDTDIFNPEYSDLRMQEIYDKWKANRGQGGSVTSVMDLTLPTD